MFSAVPYEALTDFRSALAILAEPTADGRFVPWAAAVIDSAGRLHAEDGAWPAMSPRGSVAFVHFLTEGLGAESAEDLFADTGPAELNLAA